MDPQNDSYESKQSDIRTVILCKFRTKRYLFSREKTNYDENNLACTKFRLKFKGFYSVSHLDHPYGPLTLIPNHQTFMSAAYSYVCFTLDRSKFSVYNFWENSVRSKLQELKIRSISLHL